MGKGLGDAMDVLDGFRDAASGGQGLRGRAARAVCDAYASNPVAGAMVSASNRGFGASMQYGCGPYWEGPDGYTPPTPANDEVPFQGGQCVGVDYRARFAYEGATQGSQTVSTSFIAGPITEIIIEPQFENDGNPNREPYFVGLRNDKGDEDTVVVATDNTVPSFIGFVTDPPGADGCGDPEPVFVPPSAGSPPPGRGFGDPRDIGEPGEPYVITPRPPVIGPDGQPTMPVDTPTGPVDFRPDGEEPGPGGDPAIGEPIDVDPGSGEVDEDPEDALTKPTLLGYRYTVRDTAPRFQSVIPGTNPRIYSRVVGSVQLILRGENGTFYSNNLQITSEEGSIVKSHPTLRVVGCVYNVLPNLGGLTLREIRGKDDDS